jgi:hypothetical protein
MNPMSKEDDWKIIKIANVDVDAISNEVLKFYNEWLIDTSRQEIFTTHENTFMYELIAFDYAWRPGQVQKSKCINELNNLSQRELKRIYDLLEDYVNGKVVHAEIISMKPNSRIRIHKDRGDMLYIARRFHVPIKTNLKTFFIVDNEKFFLEKGHLYELNNVKYHGVRNESEEYRIHLIIDVIPTEHLDKVIFE